MKQVELEAIVRDYKSKIKESPFLSIISIPEPCEGRTSAIFCAIDSNTEDILSIFKGKGFGAMGLDLNSSDIGKINKIYVQEFNIQILSLERLKDFISDENNHKELDYNRLNRKMNGNLRKANSILRRIYEGEL